MFVFDSHTATLASVDGSVDARCDSSFFCDLEALQAQAMKLFLLLIALSLTSCSGLYGPNPQPPGMNAEDVSDVQPTYH